MKRSEMIQKMEDFINSQSLMLGADMKRDCEYLLNMLEKEGMRPPSRTLSWDEQSTFQSPSHDNRWDKE